MPSGTSLALPSTHVVQKVQLNHGETLWGSQPWFGPAVFSTLKHAQTASWTTLHSPLHVGVLMHMQRITHKSWCVYGVVMMHKLLLLVVYLTYGVQMSPLVGPPLLCGSPLGTDVRATAGNTFVRGCTASWCRKCMTGRQVKI